MIRNFDRLSFVRLPRPPTLADYWCEIALDVRMRPEGYGLPPCTDGALYAADRADKCIDSLLRSDHRTT